MDNFCRGNPSCAGTCSSTDPNLDWHCIASTRARADHCAIAQPKETHARRKAIYEKLHPEAKAGVAQAKGMNTALGNVADKLSATSYADDAANAVGDKAPRARGLTSGGLGTRVPRPPRSTPCNIATVSIRCPIARVPGECCNAAVSRFCYATIAPKAAVFLRLDIQWTIDNALVCKWLFCNPIAPQSKGL